MKSQDFQMMALQSSRKSANQNEDFCQTLEDQSVVPCLCMLVSPSQAELQQPSNMNQEHLNNDVWCQSCGKNYNTSCDKTEQQTLIFTRMN